MSDSHDSSIIKTLVDSLTTTLTKISIKQEAMEATLERLERNAADSQAVLDAKQASKEALEEIEEARKDIMDKLEQLEKDMEPVIKFSDLMRKPIAIIVAILLFLAAAFSVLGIFEKVSETWKPEEKPARTETQGTGSGKSP